MSQHHIVLHALLGALALTACGRSTGVGPMIERVTPMAATNEQAVVVEIGARDIAALGLPRVFLDELELGAVEPRGVDAIAVTVPPAMTPATHALNVLMPDGSVARGHAMFTVLAAGSSVH